MPAMNEPLAPSEFLVISRGQWDEGLSPERIQTAIDHFYDWLDQLVAKGKMRKGQRLANQGKTVSRRHTVTDGPFGETKEVIGGYWFITAGSLEEAAELASTSPTLDCGIFYEIRPVDPERCTAFTITAETPKGGLRPAKA
jgi:hypothetical protein